MNSQPSGDFAWTQDTPHPGLVCRPLIAKARHLYTTRAWQLGTSRADAEEAWAEVADAIGVAPARLVRVRQVHGRAVLVVRTTADWTSPAEADVITTDAPDVAIAVQAADCAPILLADPAGPVAAAHAGWRGLAAGVPEASARAMRDAWKSRPADLLAAVGPCIGPCCYEIGTDVRDAFAAARLPSGRADRWFGQEHRPGHWSLDIWAAACDQLASSGIPRHQIYCARLCTACSGARFSSYRRDGGAAGRIAAAIRAGRPSDWRSTTCASSDL